MVGLGELPCFLCRSDVEAHLSDVAPGWKFNGRPNGAVEVGLVLFEVIACPKFIGLVDPKAEGDVDRTVCEGCDRTIEVDRKWWREPPLSNWPMASFQRASSCKKPDARDRVSKRLWG